MPINPKMHLVENLHDIKSLEQKPTRDGYDPGLVQVADANPDVAVALCADL